ncbi:hypothetical protein Dimus_036447, partial [Dionaea muscipula]
ADREDPGLRVYTAADSAAYHSLADVSPDPLRALRRRVASRCCANIAQSPTWLAHTNEVETVRHRRSCDPRCGSSDDSQ